MLRCLTLLFAALLPALTGLGADWPCYGADPQRSFTTDDTLVLPLTAAWSYRPGQAPKPAWPEPGKELHRIDFDYAFQPVIAGGLVIFGSSGDGAVRALDLASGELRWRVATGGPVRFAPQVWEQKVYVAGDDGHLYCFALADGKLLWEKRLAPKTDLLVGNEQICSRWPMRSGVVIADGVLYTSVGMWPTEGVLVMALDPNTGAEIWHNDTCGRIFSDFPHSSAYAIAGVIPQGYGALSEKTYVVPCGRAEPAGFDRATGKLLYVNEEAHKRWPDGGCRVSVLEPFMFNGCTFGTLVHVKANPDAADPVEYEGTKAYDVNSGRTAHQRFLPIQAYSTNPFYRILAARDRIFTVSSLGVLNATLTAEPASRSFARRLWTTDFDGRRIYEMAWAGNHLVIGDRGRILIHDAETGDRLAELPIDGEPRGLAISDGRLIVALQDGRLVCFAHDAPAQAVVHDETQLRNFKQRAKPAHTSAFAPLANLPAGRGFAVVDGLPDAEESWLLAELDGLRPVQLVADPGSWRKTQLDRAYPPSGWPVTFLAPDRLRDLPAWFANVVVAQSPDAARLKLLYRVLHPYTGIMYLAGKIDPAILDAAGIPAAERETVAEGTWIRRGPPPDDQIAVKPPFQMAWFGGPGPNRMADRHITDAPRPQAENGQYYVIGEHWLLGVDAFNGVEQWCMPLQNACIRDAYTYSSMVQMNAAPGVLRLQLEHGPFIDLDPRDAHATRYYGLPLATEQLAFVGARAFELTPEDAKLAEKRQVKSEITLTPTDTALEVTFVLTDPIESLYDRVELCFDFRPPAERFGLYGPGAFHFTVHPPTHYDRGTVSKFLLEYPRQITRIPRPEKNQELIQEPYALAGAGPRHPAYTLKGDWEDGNRRTVTMTIPWTAIAEITGNDHREFGFAAFARAGDNQVDMSNKKPFVVMGFHANSDVVRVNNGWPVFSPAAATDGPLTPQAASPLLASLDDMPKLPQNQPPSVDTGWKMVSPERHHPLTGAITRRTFRPAHGCAVPISEGVVSYFRSATIAWYDYETDSGVHTIPGVRPGCQENSGILPAMGRLIYSERSSGCSCAYNLQTSFAMAPADVPTNEDWGIFYEEANLDAIRMASLNLSAPGDQRDSAGDLWLGFPRPWNRDRPSLTVPAQWTIDTADGLGEYRFNADLHPIAGTDRPWVYAGGVTGLREFTVDLKRTLNLVALRTPGPITLDGRLDEETWNQDEVAERVLLRIPEMLYDREYWDRYRTSEPYSDWAVARYDDQNLYVAFFDTAKVSRRGVAQKWIARATEFDDPAILSDNRYEVFVSDGHRRRVVHVVTSATGARYDALCADNTTGPEDAAWNGDWKSAAVTDEAGFIVEMAIPWKTLADAGLDVDTLAVNLYSFSQSPFRHRYLRYPGQYGNDRCLEFVPLGRDVPRPPRERTFTVSLHFSEPDPAVKPGQRIFAVKLQGRTVLDRLDVRAEAGAADTALVRTFAGIKAAGEIKLELVPLAQAETPQTAPILSGIQFRDEDLVLPALAATPAE